jgi:hypothetical protein
MHSPSKTRTTSKPEFVRRKKATERWPFLFRATDEIAAATDKNFDAAIVVPDRPEIGELPRMTPAAD